MEVNPHRDVIEVYDGDKTYRYKITAPVAWLHERAKVIQGRAHKSPMVTWAFCHHKLLGSVKGNHFSHLFFFLVIQTTRPSDGLPELLSICWQTGMQDKLKMHVPCREVKRLSPFGEA